MINFLAGKTGEFRFYFLVHLALLFLVLNAILRLVLQIAFPSVLPFSTSMFPGLLKGALNDCAALAFALLLPAILILLPTNKFLQRHLGKCYSILIIFIFSVVFIFTAFAEYFFWEEFECRFNFIAVDYLIYTTELMRNMIESYPLSWLLAGVFFLAVGATALLWKRLRKLLPPRDDGAAKSAPGKGSLKGRLGTLGALYLLAALLFWQFTPLKGDQNRFWNEYAKNGTYEIFSAYLHNELDYRAFYKTIDRQEAFSLMRYELLDATSSYELPNGESLVRLVAAKDLEKLSDEISTVVPTVSPTAVPAVVPNVVIVIMESMGRNWLGEHTPYLNELTDKGLSFTNMMSTGTRTVRGIEAVMLSIPPTPGNSIVRRPDNDKLYNLGTLFRRKGYTLDFIYGGIGYFDNMNAFFAGNGYRVTDKLNFSRQSNTFSNAWGQCDEDLYSESLRLADESFQSGLPFHQVLLTTSNHRPFTFPEGRIEIEQGSRQAAVRYADYAAGKFIRDAQEKDWFANTIFVFVGDHPSSIAGKTEVPSDAYGIVCVIYGPTFFTPEKINTLCSQIDLAPTLLASLGWEYSSPFFGTNVRQLPTEAGRAWISTYQLLGFRTTDRLVILKPDASAEVTHLATMSAEDANSTLTRQADEIIISRAVASYQCAYDLFTQKRLKESFVDSCAMLLRN